MPTQSYKQNNSRKVFTNHPFRNGMVYEDVTLNERQLKTSINFDISNAGDFAYPRGAFVNALLHDGYSPIHLPNIPIKQQTNLGKTFLLASDYKVATEEYVEQDLEAIATDVSTPLRTPFGLRAVLLRKDTESFKSRGGYKEVYYIRTYDGDTITVKDTLFGPDPSYDVRFLGVDTPEIGKAKYIYDSFNKRLYLATNNTVVYEAVYDSLIGAPDSSTFYLLDGGNLYLYTYFSYGYPYDIVTIGTTFGYDLLTKDLVMAVEAKTHVQNTLGTLEKIIIGFDPYSSEEDKYERTLAYVYKQVVVGDTIQYLNLSADLVRRGLATVRYTSQINTHYNLLMTMQEQAKHEELGIWNTTYQYPPLAEDNPWIDMDLTHVGNGTYEGSIPNAGGKVISFWVDNYEYLGNISPEHSMFHMKLLDEHAYFDYFGWYLPTLDNYLYEEGGLFWTILGFEEHDVINNPSNSVHIRLRFKTDNSTWVEHGDTITIKQREFVEVIEVPNDIAEEVFSFDPTAVEPFEGTEIFTKACVDVTSNIDPILYDTHSYMAATKTRTNLFETEDTDVLIQFLENTYDKKENEYSITLKEVPHADNTWRNSITILGRVIVDGIVKYRGPIIFQYDGVKHHVIIIKPKEIQVGSYNLNDPTSINFNAFSDTPYVFKDLLPGDVESAYFHRPAILSALIYDREITTANKKLARVLKGFNPQQQCFIKPYVVIPNITITNLVGVYMRYKLRPDMKKVDGWFKIAGVTNGALVYDSAIIAAQSLVSGDLQTFDFSALNARPLDIELSTIYRKNTHTNSVGLAADIQIIPKNLDGDIHNLEQIYTSCDYTITSTSIAPYVDVATGYNYERRKITTYDNMTSRFLQENIISGDVLGTDGWTFEIPAGSFVALDLDKAQLPFTIKIKHNVANTGDTTVYTYRTEIDYTDEIFKSVATTQMIYHTGTEFVDQQEMLKTYNVWKATDISLFDRYLLLYGPHMGGHAIQFLEYDRFDEAPFPFGQIVFNRPIVHVHEHRNSLYVFCDDGISILHSGLTYLDLRQTFAYSGIELHPTEKHTVASVGNNVFVMHDRKGYVIRTNQMVQDASDIFTVLLTHPIDSIIDSPRLFLKDRFQYGYGVLVEDTTNIKATFVSFNYNNELHLYGTFFIKNIDTPMLINFIYDVDKKRWRMYDSIVGGVPIAKTSDGSTKTYGLIMLNHYDKTFPTYGQYAHFLPKNDKEYQLGDAASVLYTHHEVWEFANSSANMAETIMPISCFFDTGSLGFSTMHAKRIRRIYVDLVNIAGTSLQFSIMPYVDGIPVSTEVETFAIVDASGDITTHLELNVDSVDIPKVYLVTPGSETIEGFQITESMLTTRNRIRIDSRTNIVGRLPGFTMLIPTIDSFSITHYGMVYRMQSAR